MCKLKRKRPGLQSRLAKAIWVVEIAIGKKDLLCSH